jgi:uncharacterized membrane protein
MDTTAAASPDTLAHVLRLITWCLIVFAGLWLVTSLIGYFHRRAYNLTRAESGPSKNIQPDFLKVDKEKRQAAIDRGKAYTEVLDARSAPPVAPAVKTVHHWSWLLASAAAVLGLGVTILGALAKIGDLQRDVERIGSWDRFSQLVSQNQAGAVVAVAVIGANVIVVAQKLKKPTS